MNYLLDTCTISDFFKKNHSVVQHFESLVPDQLRISVITVMEIEYGLQLNPQRAVKIRPLWESLLHVLQIELYSERAAMATAAIRANLKALGAPIGPYDILIAGTAVAHKMVVVTSNVDEFTRISEVSVENWRI